MIDYISCEALLSERQANDVLKKSPLQWKTTIDDETGELERKYCEYRGMRFSIEYLKTIITTDGQKIRIQQKDPILSVRNSIHTFWHGGNDNNFSRRDLLDAFEYMKTKLGIDPSVLQRKSFEFGVNIETTEPPPSIFNLYLDYRQKQPFTPMKRRSDIEYLKGAKGVECELSQFRIKAYDKGTQYGLDRYLYRFEIVVNKVQFLEKQGITPLSKLSDLGKLETLESLGNVLLNIYDRITKKTLVNDAKAKELTKADLEILRLGETPQYWKFLKETKGRTTVWKTQRRYKDLINLTAKKNIHAEIRTAISQKWQQLLTGLPIGEHVTDTGKMNKVTTFEKCPEPVAVVNLALNKLDSFGTVSKDRMNEVTTSCKGNFVHSLNTVSNTNTRLCCVCGKDLSNRRPNTLTCSKKCRNKKSNEYQNPLRPYKRDIKKVTLFETGNLVKTSF
jgi:hypothetical protein